MPIKDQEQAFNLHEEFRARAMRDVEALRSERPPSIEALVKEGKERIARVRARIESAKKERDALVRSWDERIARLKNEVEQLDAGAREMEKRVSKAQAVKHAPSDATSRKKKK